MLHPIKIIVTVIVVLATILVIPALAFLFALHRPDQGGQAFYIVLLVVLGWPVFVAIIMVLMFRISVPKIFGVFGAIWLFFWILQPLISPYQMWFALGLSMRIQPFLDSQAIRELVEHQKTPPNKIDDKISYFGSVKGDRSFFVKPLFAPNPEVGYLLQWNGAITDYGIIVSDDQSLQEYFGDPAVIRVKGGLYVFARNSNK